MPRTARPRLIDPYCDYLRERVVQYTDLSGMRHLREIRDLRYQGAYSAVTDYLRNLQPAEHTGFERRRVFS